MSRRKKQLEIFLDDCKIKFTGDSIFFTELKEMKEIPDIKKSGISLFGEAYAITLNQVIFTCCGRKMSN